MPILFDRIIALIVILIASPLLVLCYVGVKLSSRGPFLYAAERVGLNNQRFLMYKIRTMRDDSGNVERKRITANNDPRVFPFGQFLRASKIDELPQLFNVLKGDMAIVGPRPEDPDIVDRYYSDWHFDTLKVRPGLASPGSLFNYSHFSRYVKGGDTENEYVTNFLDRKLALDAVYACKKSFLYDVKIIFRTAFQIVVQMLGLQVTKNPPEARNATEYYKVKYDKF